jgi:protein-S-isoprenylcysteine O-methyltransferase Ste14
VNLAIFTGASLLNPSISQEKIQRFSIVVCVVDQRQKKKLHKRSSCFLPLFGFIALLVVPALDYRFGWSGVPLPLVITGDTLVAIGFYFIFLVYRENTFTSATIEVAENQKVISTGPYALARHPMYASALLYLIGTPLALGSYWGFLALLFVMSFLIWRLFDEETFLAKNLPGYTEYQKKVQHRLVPHLR